MAFFNLGNGLYCVQSGVFLTEFGRRLPLSLSDKPGNICVKQLGKIIAWTLCFMHQSTFRPEYIFNNDAYF